MKNEIKTLVASDRTMLGDPIPKSKYYRTFCWTCGEPMRTTMGKIYNPIHCEICCGGSGTSEYIDLRELHNVDNYMPNVDNEEKILNKVEKKIRRKF